MTDSNVKEAKRGNLKGSKYFFTAECLLNASSCWRCHLKSVSLWPLMLKIFKGIMITCKCGFCSYVSVNDNKCYLNTNSSFLLPQSLLIYLFDACVRKMVYVYPHLGHISFLNLTSSLDTIIENNTFYFFYLFTLFVLRYVCLSFLNYSNRKRSRCNLL